MKNSVCVVLLLIFFLAPFQSGYSLQAEESDKKPAPYEEGEFPPWLTSLRRGEIIFFGSYPITLLASTLVYGLIRFAANGFDVNYAPQPFAGAGAQPYVQSDYIGIAVAAACTSLAVAVLDYFIFKKQEEDRRERFF